MRKHFFLGITRPLVFSLSFLLIFNNQLSAQVNQLSKKEYELLRAEGPINYRTAYRGNEFPAIYKVIEEYRTNASQLFARTVPDNPYEIYLQIYRNDGKQSLGTAFFFSYKDQDTGHRMEVFFRQFRFSSYYKQAKRDRMKLLDGNYDSYRNHPIKVCQNNGIYSLTTNRLDYFNDQTKAQIYIINRSEQFLGMENEKALLIKQAEKICAGFRQKGIYGLMDHLFSLPYPGMSQNPATTSSKKTEKEDSKIDAENISVTINLVDVDDQFTLADEATLEVTVSNNSDNKIEGLELNVSVLKEAVSAYENNFGPSIYKKLKDVLLWNPGVTLKSTDDPVEFAGNESLNSKPFDLNGKDQETIRMTIKSASEDNSWIYKSLIVENKSPLVSGLLESKITTSEGTVAFKGQPVVTFKGNDAKLTYPNFDAPASRISDQSNLPYYLKGDAFFNIMDAPYIRLLACRAARHNRTYVPEGEVRNARRLASIVLPEQQHKIVENIAYYVYDAFQRKHYPEPLLPNSIHAQNIVEGEYGLGKPIEDPQKLHEDILNQLQGIKKKTGFACIENAYMFGNLTRLLGFPTREINCLEYFLPIQINPSQDASTEVFYLDHDSGEYKWNYFGLFNFDGYPHRDPAILYNKGAKYFYLWRGVASDPRADAENNRFLKDLPELQGSYMWELYASGGLGEIDYEGPWAIENQVDLSRMELRALSPLTMYLELPDGKSIGSKGELKITEALKRQFATHSLSDYHERLLIPFEGAAYIPEGLPMINPTPPYLEETTQKIILPENYIDVMDDLTVQLYGTGNGEYTLQLSTIKNGTETKFSDIKGYIQEGEIQNIKLADFKSDEMPNKKTTTSKNTSEKVSWPPEFLSTEQLYLVLLGCLALIFLLLGIIVGSWSKRK